MHFNHLCLFQLFWFIFMIIIYLSIVLHFSFLFFSFPLPPLVWCLPINISLHPENHTTFLFLSLSSSVFFFSFFLSFCILMMVFFNRCWGLWCDDYYLSFKQCVVDSSMEITLLKSGVKIDYQPPLSKFKP